MVDPGRVRSLLDRLAEETRQLERLAEASPDELLNDQVILAAVKYGFVVSIETCIDAAQHIISSEGLRTPDSFAEAFAIVSEARFLPKELVPRLQEMARFRNLLVHG